MLSADFQDPWRPTFLVREFLNICLTSGAVLALLRDTLGAISRFEMIFKALDRVRRLWIGDAE
jgi:hypothetical protein